MQCSLIDDSFEVTLPDDAGFGENFTMCVQLTFGNCMEMASRDFTSKSVILTQILTYVHVVFPPQFPVKTSLH